jgi:predicted PurR-regulated permease PerM
MRLRTYFYALAAVALTFYILLVGKKLLIPLIVAVILWYLINALAQGFGRIPLGKIRLATPVRFGLSIVTILGILFGLSTLVTENIADLINIVPEYERNLQRLIGRVFGLLGLQEPPSIQQLLQSLDLRSGLSRVAVAVTGTVGNIGIVLVYMVFLFLEQKSFDAKMKALVGSDSRRRELAELFRHVESDIRLYVGIKMLTSSATGIASYVVMALIGLDFAEFWAILIFLFNFIPTVGSIIATAFPTLLALVQFESIGPFLVVGLGIGSLQFFIGNILEPRLMGNRLNLSPLVIVLSLALFASLWGFTGMILSVPVMAIVLIALSHFPQTRPIAIALSRRGQLSDLNLSIGTKADKPKTGEYSNPGEETPAT